MVALVELGVIDSPLGALGAEAAVCVIEKVLKYTTPSNVAK